MISLINAEGSSIPLHIVGMPIVVVVSQIENETDLSFDGLRIVLGNLIDVLLVKGPRFVKEIGKFRS